MRVIIDRETCSSSGTCAMYFPEIFDQDADDGRAVLLTAFPSESQRADVGEAILRCPTNAISLVEESTAPAQH
ncbi:ferredoxin [Actinoplanes sp. TFC3]|uniref:ferredoxin n=1 Tax=Actinoplanes sp. TFC3 TaxID=1710355 RepID=UPI00082E3884|nr:ferredoxin [Actinoplanes sp. TFC3]